MTKLQLPKQKAAITTTETHCQEVKLMYMAVVCEKGPILLQEMTWEGGLTVSGKPAKGVTGPVLAPFIKKIAAAARKVMGPGPIGCWLDNAKAHHAACVVAELEKHFNRVLFQPPSSPDMNMLDAGVFPHMGRLVQGFGCVTKPEIRAAVKKVWKNGVTTGHCGRVAARVRRNMTKYKGCKGGNWFEEC